MTIQVDEIEDLEILPGIYVTLTGLAAEVEVDPAGEIDVSLPFYENGGHRRKGRRYLDPRVDTLSAMIVARIRKDWRDEIRVQAFEAEVEAEEAGAARNTIQVYADVSP